MDITKMDRQFKTKGEVDQFIQDFINYKIIMGSPVVGDIRMFLENWIGQLIKILMYQKAVNGDVARYALEGFSAVFEIITNSDDIDEDLKVFLEKEDEKK